MSTQTYSSPVQEFYASMTAAATAAVVNVFELIPPRGFRLILQQFEGVPGTGGFSWLVSTGSQITGAATTPVTTVFIANPGGIMTGVATIGTRVAAPAGYRWAPAFRQPCYTNAVCDSILDQRFVWAATVINEANEMYIRGLIVPSEFDTEKRYTLR